MNRTLAMITLSAAALLQACATASAPASIADTASRTAQLSTLNRLMADAGLADTLRGPGPYTLFAPSDDAFKAMPPKTMAELASNKELLKSVLSFHVIPGKVVAADVKTGNAKTVQGSSLALGKAGSHVTVGDAIVTQADIPASNGVVHMIDRVLMPPKK